MAHRNVRTRTTLMVIVAATVSSLAISACGGKVDTVGAGTGNACGSGNARCPYVPTEVDECGGDNGLCSPAGNPVTPVNPAKPSGKPTTPTTHAPDPPAKPPVPPDPDPPIPPITPPPPTGIDTSWTWESHAFTYDRAQTSCSGGARYVRFSSRYNKWVGVELCSPTRYKIYLGESKDGVFHEIGDFAGHGQDHCELVSATFKIPNEDDITSGGCASCDLEMGSWERPGSVPVYSRNVFGGAFTLQSWPEHNLYTSTWYQCGVSIP